MKLISGSEVDSREKCVLYTYVSPCLPLFIFIVYIGNLYTYAAGFFAAAYFNKSSRVNWYLHCDLTAARARKVCRLWICFRPGTEYFALCGARAGISGPYYSRYQ